MNIPPRKQLAVVRFPGRPQRVAPSVLVFTFLPCLIGAMVALITRKQQGIDPWVVVAAIAVYTVAAIVVMIVRHVRAGAIASPPDPRVDEPLSEALARAGISAPKVRTLRARQLARINSTLGTQPPRLWISSRIDYDRVDGQPTYIAGLFSLAHATTLWGRREYIVTIVVGVFSLTVGMISAITLTSNRPGSAGWIGLAIAAVPPLWAIVSWVCQLSTLGLAPGEITLYRRWRVWIHTVKKLLLITTAFAPPRGRHVNLADVRVVMVHHPVVPTDRSEIWRAVFDTRARGPERIYSWVFIGNRRPLAVPGVAVDTWRLVLHAQPPRSS